MQNIYYIYLVRIKKYAEHIENIYSTEYAWAVGRLRQAPPPAGRIVRRGVRPCTIPSKRPGRENDPEVVRTGEMAIAGILVRRSHARASPRSWKCAN
jgi:hypothetical protein